MSLRPRGGPQTSVPAVGVPSAPRAFPAPSMRLKQVLELGAKFDADGNEIPGPVDSIMAATGLSKLAVKTVQGLASYFVLRSEDLEGDSNMFLPGSNFDTDDLRLLSDTFKLYEGSEPKTQTWGMERKIRKPTDREMARTADRLGLNPFEREVYTNLLVTVDPSYVPHFILDAKKLKLLSTKPDKFQLVANTIHWYITSFLPGRQIITALLHMSMNPTIVDITDNHVVKRIVNFKTGELESVLNEIQKYFARISVGVFEPRYDMFTTKAVSGVKREDDVGSTFVGPEKMVVRMPV
jgi:hypothetical protein